MTVIERDALWACPVHGGTGGMQGRDETGVIHCASCRREAVEYVPAEQLRGAVKALEHIAESAEHPSLTVRTTEYLGHVAREALAALALPRTDQPNTEAPDAR